VTAATPKKPAKKKRQAALSLRGNRGKQRPARRPQESGNHSKGDPPCSTAASVTRHQGTWQLRRLSRRTCAMTCSQSAGEARATRGRKRTWLSFHRRATGLYTAPGQEKIDVVNYCCDAAPAAVAADPRYRSQFSPGPPPINFCRRPPHIRPVN
jgi:hypothetical protein